MILRHASRGRRDPGQASTAMECKSSELGGAKSPPEHETSKQRMNRNPRQLIWNSSNPSSLLWEDRQRQCRTNRNSVSTYGLMTCRNGADRYPGLWNSSQFAGVRRVLHARRGTGGGGDDDTNTATTPLFVFVFVFRRRSVSLDYNGIMWRTGGSYARASGRQQVCGQGRALLPSHPNQRVPFNPAQTILFVIQVHVSPDRLF